MTCRHIFCKQGEQVYAKVKDSLERQFGPKTSVFRESNLSTEDQSTAFDFASVFPQTHAQLTSGRFRWFKYHKGVLRTLVGRGIGENRRGFGKDQILRTVKSEFTSLHQLLCTVEGSWVHPHDPTTPLGATILSEFDLDLGPSNPMPGSQTPTYCKEQNDKWTLISQENNNRKKLVTTLATALEGGLNFVYSGHDDGTLTKWSLDTNELVWTRQVFPDQTKYYGQKNGGIGLCMQDTAGIAEIVVRKDPRRPGHSLVYVWTDYKPLDEPA